MPAWLIGIGGSCLIASISCLIGIIVLVYIRYHFFGGYLSPSQVAGDYRFAGGDIAETLLLNKDTSYVQTLKMNGKVYESKGKYWINTGAEIWFYDIFVRCDARGQRVDPPKVEHVVATHWQNDGTITFVLPDRYYLKRQKK